MWRIRYCLTAALVMILAACGSERPADEAQQTANAVQQPAKVAKPAEKAPPAKCHDVATKLPVQVNDLTRKTYACVERTALLYAKGPDSIEALSRAVIAKCKDTIVQYVDQESKKVGQKPQYKEPLESWQSHSLAIMAEARARRC